jgi:hypothetical protein
MKTVLVTVFAFVLPLFAIGAEQPEYLASFDPAKGFKPAQHDLTEIFLQIAGSLEYYGSPVPYMQHMAKEHERIDALYIARYGTVPKSYRPAYMTDEYLNRFAKNWDYLSPKLGLDSFAKEVGNDMRAGINGTRGTGTIAVDILNQHQARVFDAMSEKGTGGADYESLKTDIITRLELDKESIDDRNYTIAHRDAEEYGVIIEGVTFKLFKRLDDNLPPESARVIKSALIGVFNDVGAMADSELKAGIAEWALKQQTAATK